MLNWADLASLVTVFACTLVGFAGTKTTHGRPLLLLACACAGLGVGVLVGGVARKISQRILRAPRLKAGAKILLYLLFPLVAMLLAIAATAAVVLGLAYFFA